MVGFGQGNNGREARGTKPAAKTAVEKQPTLEPPMLTAGQLPDDAFSQFPPLSAQQQSTLQDAQDVLDGGGLTGLPSEASHN